MIKFSGLNSYYKEREGGTGRQCASYPSQILHDIGENIQFFAIALGGPFMIRRSEYPGAGLDGRRKNTFRRRIRGIDIEPMYQANRAKWEGEVDPPHCTLKEVKQTGENHGAVRTGGRPDDMRPNASICVVRNLQVIIRMFLDRAIKETHPLRPMGKRPTDRILSGNKTDPCSGDG